MLRLLIVDDEVLVGLSLREELAEYGCQVFVEHDAESALSKGTDRLIDAAILDISLPGIQGDELARQLRAQFATLPIVLSTGWTIQEISDDLKDDPQIAFLQKPYRTESLFATLRGFGLDFAETQKITAA